ncbi:VanZ family protein [Actinoplanes sp. TFC3]|uniref:VanZ family protein n=1 Tax=Actinoplanes sp. TFC3 TaxID=1710355 RepID=UPI00082B38F0|nr:VanZ family protein [Actinoplanes sp. TFC3]
MLNEEMALRYLAMPAVWAILLTAAAAAAAFGRRLAARYGAPTLTGVLFILAVGCIAALTAPLDTSQEIETTRIPFSYVVDTYTHSEIYRELLTLPVFSERWANVVLFLPIGVLGYLLSRRFLRTTAFGAAFSLAIEVWQTVIGRIGDINDLRNNVIGTALGALVALVILRVPGVRRTQASMPVPAGRGQV